LPTMLDVARHANVSLSTVSYALNGTRPISEKTRQHIFAVMDELGYRPNILARGLASKRSKIIALLFPAPERGLGITELEFVTSANDVARELGYSLILWPSDLRDIGELRKLTQEGLVDGIILMEVRLNDERVELLRRIEFPFSMIGRSEELGSIAYSDVDFEQTTQDAVRYLRKLGHTRIGFLNQSQLAYEHGYGPAVRTQAAFEQIMKAGGEPVVARFCKTSPQAGYEACNQFLVEHPELTALVIMNERAVPGVIQALSDRGLNVPQDFSLVGIISSAHAAEMMRPPLTTMDIQTKELGHLAVEFLIQQLEEGGPGTKRQQLVPCVLTVRGSSDVCRSAAGAGG
jgi:DNA-binding LacI/PurR family transcriptional regulator